MRWSVLVAGLLLLTAGCGGCIWSMFERPRWSYEFDIGGGRTLTVWSIRRDTHIFSGNFLDPNPLMIYYRVDSGSHELVHTTWLDFDEGGEYHFRLVQGEGGRLTCVYEATRGMENPFLLVIYDTQAKGSWPRTRNEDGDDPWRERFMRLKADNPDLPTPSYFLVGPPAP